MSTPEPQPQQSSSRPTLLPSPFSRADQNLSPEPQPVQATSASIYSPDPDELAYQPPEQEGLLPPPSFNPLFTLISDAATGEVYHPSTYYVFVDDDTAPDVMSTAALQALETYNPQPRPSQPQQITATDPDVEERYLIVDLANDGAAVTAAQSLAPRWAVTNAKVSAAPMFGGADNGQEGGSMMLMVEGVSNGRETSPRGGNGSKALRAHGMLNEARQKCDGSITAAMGDILASSNSDLAVLGKVVGVEQEPG